MGRKEGHYSIVMKAGLTLYADREAAFNRHPKSYRAAEPMQARRARKRGEPRTTRPGLLHVWMRRGYNGSTIRLATSTVLPQPGPILTADFRPLKSPSCV